MSPHTPRSQTPRHAGFETTHWSVVLAAAGRESPDTNEALERLCRTYWYPLYAYVRRRGLAPEDAEDLTQEFFSRLLTRGYLARSDPAKGRFRAFLLAGIDYLLADERDKARTLKRGGGARHLSLDTADAEVRFRLEPADALTPERLFERNWVASVIEASTARLRAEYSAPDRAGLFEAMSGFLVDASGQPSYGEMSARLGLTGSAVKSAVHRLRRRHHELIRDEIAQTVADPSEVADELRYLLRVMAAP